MSLRLANTRKQSVANSICPIESVRELFCGVPSLSRGICSYNFCLVHITYYCVISSLYISTAKSVPLDLWSLATSGTQETERNRTCSNCWGAAWFRKFLCKDTKSFGKLIVFCRENLWAITDGVLYGVAWRREITRKFDSKLYKKKTLKTLFDVLSSLGALVLSAMSLSLRASS